MVRQNGFTLVEMLIALFVFGLLTSGGVAMMRFSLNNEAVVREHTARLSQLQAESAILKADLSQAALRPVRGADGSAGPDGLGGGGDGALFSLVRRGWENPDGAPRASEQRVEYRLAGGRLERLASQALDGAPFNPPRTLIEGVSGLRVTYLSHGAWTGAPPLGELPQAVRLDITIARLGQISQLFLVSGGAS